MPSHVSETCFFQTFIYVQGYVPSPNQTKLTLRIYLAQLWVYLAHLWFYLQSSTKIVTNNNRNVEFVWPEYVPRFLFIFNIGRGVERQRETELLTWQCRIFHFCLDNFVDDCSTHGFTQLAYGFTQLAYGFTQLAYGFTQLAYGLTGFHLAYLVFTYLASGLSSSHKGFDDVHQSLLDII